MAAPTVLMRGPYKNVNHYPLPEKSGGKGEENESYIQC